MRSHEARTASTSQRALHVRITVGGHDLGSLEGWDWVEEIAIQSDVDQAVAELTLALRREIYSHSIAPTMARSRPNRDAGAYAPLLTLRALIAVAVSEAPTAAAAGGDAHPWHEIFRGRIDQIDWSSTPIRIRARDLAADALDRWIEDGRSYGLLSGVEGVRVWSPGLAVAEGEYLAPSDYNGHRYGVIASGTTGAVEPEWPTDGAASIADGTATLRRSDLSIGSWYGSSAYDYGEVVAVEIIEYEIPVTRYYCAVVAGTSASVAPTWPTTPGATVDDGGVRWQALPDVLASAHVDAPLCLEALLQSILRASLGDDAPPIWCPVSPGYYVRGLSIAPSSALEQMRRLAGMIGWDVRLAFVPTALEHATWGQWRLHLHEPARRKTAPDAILAAHEIYGARQCALALAEIRNAIDVEWSTEDDAPLPDGNRPRRRIRVVDQDSVAAYGRRYMGIMHGSISLISTAAEAESVALAAVSDLAQPMLSLAIDMPMRWWIELGDLLTIEGDGIHYDDEARDVAVVGVSHAISRGAATTSIATRGRPTGGVHRWLELSASGGEAYSPAPAPIISAATPIQDGVRVEWGFGYGVWPSALRAVECHVSPTSAFAPSSATIKAVASVAAPMTIGGLTPGATYYARLIGIGHDGIHGAPSPQMAFRAGGDWRALVRLADDDSGAEPRRIDYDEVVEDRGDIWDDAGYCFVAPVAGTYRVSVSALIDSTAEFSEHYLGIVGVAPSSVSVQGEAAFGDGTRPELAQVSALLDLAEGEAVEIWLASTASDATLLTGASTWAEMARVWT